MSRRVLARIARATSSRQQGKVTSLLSYTYMHTKSGENNNATSVLRLNLAWKIFPKHTLKFSAGSTFMNHLVMDEQTQEMASKKSNETRLVLYYAINFVFI